MSKKLTYGYVKQYFEDHECELLEEEYVNNNTKMKYKCVCGNESEIIFGSFQQGKRCIKCGGKEKHIFKYVKQYFLDNNCEL